MEVRALFLVAFTSVFQPSLAVNLGLECVSGAVDSASFVADVATHPQDQVLKIVRDANDFSKFPDKSKGPQRDYTWLEVAKYDGEEGRQLFIVLDRKVYDITDFADMHPAGPKVLKKYAGRDASVAMRATSMPPVVYETQIKLFKVGQIAASEAEGSYEVS